MKSLKTWFVLPFLFAVPFTFAAPKSNPSAAKVELSIDSTLDINVNDRETIIDANGQALSQFKYEITNKSDKPIKNIQWISVYTHNREVIYSQDMQLELDNPIQPAQVVSIHLQIPFAKIDEKYRPIFLNTQEPIKVYKTARVIEFLNKKKLMEE